MIINLRLERLVIFLVSISLFGLTSCNKFEGDVTIPSFLQIDTVYLSTNISSQGENTHEITDVWVYVDDQQMGVFELPAKFPLLYNGKHKLEIRAGIKLNGISSTRIPYPFYQPIVYDNFEFYPDSVMNLSGLSFKYYNTLEFPWIENFENSGVTIQAVSTSDTLITQTQPANNQEAYLSEYSAYSGIINLTSERSYFNGWSLPSFVFPGNESPVALEMDFKTNNYITIGLYVHQFDTYTSKELVILNYSDEWNHIYINLTPTVALYPNADDFKIFFEASKQSSNEEAKIYLDNIKVIHRATTK